MNHHRPQTSSPPSFAFLDSSSTVASTTASASAGDFADSKGTWLKSKASDVPSELGTGHDQYSVLGAAVDVVNSDSRMRQRRPRTTQFEEPKPRKRRGGNLQRQAAKRARVGLEAPELQLVDRETRQRDPHLLKLHLSTVKQIITEFDNEVKAAGSVGPVDFASIAGRLAGGTGVCLSPEDVQLVVSDFSPHHYRSSIGLVVMERPAQRTGQQFGLYGSVLGSNGHVIACAQAAGSRLRELWRQHRSAGSNSVSVPSHESYSDIRLRVQAAIRPLDYGSPAGPFPPQSGKAQVPMMRQAIPIQGANSAPFSSLPAAQGHMTALPTQLPFKYAGHVPTLKSATLRVVPPRNDSKSVKKPKAKPKPKAKAQLAFPGPNLIDIQRYHALQYWQSELLRLGQTAVVNSMEARSPEMGVAAQTFAFAARRLFNAADADDKGLVEGLRRACGGSLQGDSTASEELPFLGIRERETVDEPGTADADDDGHQT
ncbi:hypothetical protein FOZ60_005937 [Perkinsus olseni]|uniref:Uncharacterized protein n=1 Tax=Perkinsus olseni TaxID=32597 RepID=A0A7J6NQH4_PEROL|nr:hypothetical protein FOZ60_005937 [Perkinsus olseni]